MVTNNNDDMKLFADNLWQYFKPMLMEQLEHNIGWFRATVTANPGGGMLTVKRPFDNPFTVKAVTSMRSSKVGDNVLVFTFGENLGTNALVVGNADGHNIGGGGGGGGSGTVTAEDVGTGEYEEPLIQIAEGGTGARTAIDALVNLGPSEPVWECKNVLQPATQSITKNGITFTVNGNGTVVVNGTATALTFWGWQFSIKKGDYILSGAPSGGQLTIRDGEGGSAPQYFSGTLDDLGSSASFSVSQDTSAYMNIRIPSGTVVSNAVYYPMIRLATISDDDYVPHAKTNLQLSYDTGWVDISSYLDSHWSIRSGFTPAVRIIGSIVYFRGSVYMSTNYTDSNKLVFSSIPSQFRPSMQMGNGGSFFGSYEPYYLWIETNGNIRISTSRSTTQASHAGIDLAMLSYPLG